MVNVKVETRCNTDGDEEKGEVEKSAPINEGGTTILLTIGWGMMVGFYKYTEYRRSRFLHDGIDCPLSSRDDELYGARIMH